ncbi:hypothetical protein [Aeromicrobium sp. UC242_57]|uniref:hypothetical protein n=1 Tax=Aeromicrobium sp. UC242_57 TaxID=3374624 RepID=UPI00379B8B85
MGHVKERLAGFKAPRHVGFVDEIPRLANGKLDYSSLNQTAASMFGGDDVAEAAH